MSGWPTKWSLSACAQSPGLGFNLQQGYFGEHENALWLDGRLIPLGAAQFDFDPRQPLAPWRIRTSDGNSFDCGYYLQEGRDYFQFAKPGYVPYAYPHPLRADADTIFEDSFE